MLMLVIHIYISNINMPVCLTCGFSTFSCHAGLYFCEECGTQFEGHRKEEQDEEYVASNISNTSEIKTARSIKKKVVAFEQPWLTTEAFNIVLLHQVQALIKLGASPNLKNTVLQLWAYYLQKCEISFKENVAGDDWIPTLGFSPRNRDVQVLSGAKDIVSSRKRKRKKHESSLKETKKNVSIIENSNVVDESCGNITVTDESDDILSSSTSQCSQIEFPKRIKSSCKKSSFCKKKLQKVGAKKKNWFKNLRYAVKRNLPDYMTLPKTLSFCYLSILLLEDHVLISDIIRFVEQGYLPYMNAVTLLPPEMKCRDCDKQMLSPAIVPTMNSVISTTINLAKFLRIPKLKHPPLLQIVARYIKDFNLPYNFINHIRKIFLKIKYPDYWYPMNSKAITSNSLFYEIKALALIMVGLKLLFGLNEKSENKHSEIVTKINTLLPRLNLFIWNQWYLCLVSKVDFVKSQNLSYSKVTECIDIECLSAYYYNTIKNWTSLEKSRNEKAFDLDFRTSLRTSFSNIVMKPNFHNFVQPPSFFPLSSELLFKIGVAKSSLQYSNSPFYDWSTLKRDFSATSVQYSHRFHRKNSDLTPEVSKLLFQLKKKFYINKRKKEAGNLNVNLYNSYWYLQCMKKNVTTVYKLAPEPFKWLVNFMSEYIGCNAHDLFYEIWMVEKYVFKLK